MVSFMPPFNLSRWNPVQARRFAPVLLTFLIAVPLSAQWKVKTRAFGAGSDEHWIDVGVDLPVVTGKGNSAARKAINRALHQASDVDEFIQNARDEVDGYDPKNNHPDDEDGVFSNDWSITYKVSLNDKHLLSICFDGMGQAGGSATAYEFDTGCTFDSKSGRMLKPDDLFAGDWKPPMERLLAEYLVQWEGDDGAHTTAEDLLPLVQKADWGFYLKPHVFVVYFPKYSIFGGAAAVVEVEIPYPRLKTLIAPQSPLTYLLRSSK